MAGTASTGRRSGSASPAACSPSAVSAPRCSTAARGARSASPSPHSHYGSRVPAMGPAPACDCKRQPQVDPATVHPHEPVLLKGKRMLQTKPVLKSHRFARRLATVPTVVACALTGANAQAADFDRDSLDDFVVWRASSSTWYVMSSATKATSSWTYGTHGDVPVPGRYKSQGGGADFAFWRPSTGLWSVMNSSSGYRCPLQRFGLAGDIPVRMTTTPPAPTTSRSGDPRTAPGTSWMIAALSTRQQSGTCG